MKVTMLLADVAQVVNGKLYILGGGWSLTGPEPVASAIAVKIDVPWDEANKRHTLKFALVDDDERPVRIQTPAGENALEVSGEFEVGRPAGVKPGTPIDLVFAFNIGPLPLKPDHRYLWRCSIDGRTGDDWQLAFSTRPARGAPAPKPQGGPGATPLG